MQVSRRWFGAGIAALAASAVSSRFGLASTGKLPAATGLRVGLNTWSLRGLTDEEAIPIILALMKQEGLQDCELIANHMEPARFTPPLSAGAPRLAPTPEQIEARKAQAEALGQWRLATPLSRFEEVRRRFENEGLRIRVYSARFGSSEEENDKVFRMAKALGAEGVNTALREPLTESIAAIAARHGMTVGMQVSDLAMLERQLATSKVLRADPDIGDLTKAHIDPLEFVKTHYGVISSLDLKDAKVGGPSVPFGEGDAQMKPVLEFLRDKHVPFTVYVDCDYPGTGRSIEEVQRSVRYVRGVIPPD